MKRREPILTPEAQADVLSAATYYESERAGLGFDFLEEFERAVALIANSPLAFTLVEHRVRRALLRRFPYGLFYEVGDDQDVIVAVVDLRQDPEEILRMLKR
ncbi:MAG: type II toxin-antitoxin system RelE/ParE family toxin [Myxococcales bacterium]|nr:type II toxin-antitoxin system RelE/ParE family toxin [Myxococcales bacterium]